jgi:hypothetical protein
MRSQSRKGAARTRENVPKNGEKVFEIPPDCRKSF